MDLKTFRIEWRRNDRYNLNKTGVRVFVTLLAGRLAPATWHSVRRIGTATVGRGLDLAPQIYPRGKTARGDSFHFMRLATPETAGDATDHHHESQKIYCSQT